MTHPLVDQLYFTRQEFLRGIEGVNDEDGRLRFEPLNSIGWIVGHLAWHEQLYWLKRAQGEILLPELNDLAFGKPASTPALSAMLAAWKKVTQKAEGYLSRLDTNLLITFLVIDGKTSVQNLGTMLQRLIYHYWYHLGESQAVRQLLHHKDLPSYVGDIEVIAPYRPE